MTSLFWRGRLARTRRRRRRPTAPTTATATKEEGAALRAKPSQASHCNTTNQIIPSTDTAHYQLGESILSFRIFFWNYRKRKQNRHIFPSKAGTGTSQLKSSISFLLLCEHQKEYEANASGNWLRRLTKYLLSVESVEFGFAADQTKSFHT